MAKRLEKGKARKPRTILHNLLKFRGTDKGAEEPAGRRTQAKAAAASCMKCVSIFWRSAGLG